MRIVVCRPQVPFVSGGAELLCDELVRQLGKLGNTAELVAVPFKWYPPSQLLLNAVAWRSLDLSEVNGEAIDLVIATKYPSYAIKHPHKIVWLFHQHRQAYDLLGTNYSDLNNAKDLCEAIKRIDEASLRESEKVFAISRTVADRLRRFNGLDAEVLYPPVPNDELFHEGTGQDFVLCPTDFHVLKRVDLLVKAVPYLNENLKIILAPTKIANNGIQELARQLGVTSRIQFLEVTSRKRLADLYADSLCVYYGPYQEDYGFVTIEAFLSGKPVVTTNDAGGPTEFVADGRTGFVADPEPRQIAEKIEYLSSHKDEAAIMGDMGRQFIDRHGINWNMTLERLLKH
jgi:glycosyltransferase involved in cell wall biosynthesis